MLCSLKINILHFINRKKDENNLVDTSTYFSLDSGWFPAIVTRDNTFVIRY